MKFDYDEINGFERLSLKASLGVEVEIYFDNGEFSHIDIDDAEFMSGSTILDVMAIRFGNLEFKYISANELISCAMGALNNARSEHEQEQADEEKHYNDVSSPYLSGRV